MWIPALIFIVFSIVPSTVGYIYAFTNWSASHTEHLKFIGLKNIIQVLSDDRLITAFTNSVLYAFGKTVIVTVLGLLLAYFLNRKFRSQTALRTIYFMPSILASIVVGLIFSALFQTRHGTINGVLRLLGGKGVDWFGGRWTGVSAIICAEIWASTGYAILITLSAMQSIPSDYFEAALIDGARERQVFTKIVLPLIFPTINVNIVFNIVYGLKLFDLVKFMTDGGPGFATESMGTLILREMSAGRFAQAVSVNLVFSVILLIISLLYQHFSSRAEDALYK